jgi:hypothetical protein
MLHSHLDEATLRKRRLDGIKRVVSQKTFHGYETLMVRKHETGSEPNYTKQIVDLTTACCQTMPDNRLTPFGLKHRVEKAWSRLPKVFGSFEGAVDDRLKLLYKRDEFPLLRHWNIKKRPRDEGHDEQSDLGDSPQQPSKKVRSAGPNVEYKSAEDKQQPAAKSSGGGKRTLPGVRKAIRRLNTLARNATGRGTRFSDVDWTADDTPIEAVEGGEVWSVSLGDKKSVSD